MAIKICSEQTIPLLLHLNVNINKNIHFKHTRQNRNGAFCYTKR